jgi:hypothetical protein
VSVGQAGIQVGAAMGAKHLIRSHPPIGKALFFDHFECVPGCAQGFSLPPTMYAIMAELREFT